MGHSNKGKEIEGCNKFHHFIIINCVLLSVRLYTFISIGANFSFMKWNDVIDHSNLFSSQIRVRIPMQKN